MSPAAGASRGPRIARRGRDEDPGRRARSRGPSRPRRGPPRRGRRRPARGSRSTIWPIRPGEASAAIAASRRALTAGPTSMDDRPDRRGSWRRAGRFACLTRAGPGGCPGGTPARRTPAPSTGAGAGGTRTLTGSSRRRMARASASDAARPGSSRTSSVRSERCRRRAFNSASSSARRAVSQASGSRAADRLDLRQQVERPGGLCRSARPDAGHRPGRPARPRPGAPG